VHDLIVDQVGPQVGVRHVVGDVVHVIGAVDRLVVGRADTRTIAGIVPVPVGVVQIAADLAVHGRIAVGHDDQEVVLARLLDDRVGSVLGEVVEDRLHRLAGRGPGVGRDTVDLSLQRRRIDPALADDTAAVVVLVDAQTEAQPSAGGVDQVAKYRLQDLDTGRAGQFQ